jgi:hypothetical protein
MKIPHKIPMQTAVAWALVFASYAAIIFGLWPLAVSLGLILIAVMILNWAMNNKRDLERVRSETTRMGSPSRIREFLDRIPSWAVSVENPFRPDKRASHHYIELDVDEIGKPKSFYQRWIDRHPSRTIPPDPPLSQSQLSIAVITKSMKDYRDFTASCASSGLRDADILFTRALSLSDVRGRRFWGMLDLGGCLFNPEYEAIRNYIETHTEPGCPITCISIAGATFLSGPARTAS